MERPIGSLERESSFGARRVNGQSLRLSFQVSQAQRARLRLLCFKSGWVFEEDLGAILPGLDRTELELPGWPEEATLVQVEFYGEGRRREPLNRWLAGPGV